MQAENFQNNDIRLNYMKCLSSPVLQTFKNSDSIWFNLYFSSVFPPFGSLINEFILMSNKNVYRAKSTLGLHQIVSSRFIHSSKIHSTSKCWAFCEALGIQW